MAAKAGNARGARMALLMVVFALLFIPRGAWAQGGGGPRQKEAERLFQSTPQDPESYEFLYAWKARVRAIRAVRERIDQPGRSLSAGQLRASGASVTGTLSVPVVAGAYSNVPGPYATSEYQRRLFEDGSGTTSVKELYEEMSLGVFSVSGFVTPWASLPWDQVYYEPSNEVNSRYGRRYDFITDALTAVDPTTDFSQFDNDGPDGIPNSGDDDGIVDVTAFIYPTRPMNCGGPGIWPHRWNYPSLKYRDTGTADFFYTDDAAAGGGTIVISDYIIQSGLNCRTTEIMGSGTTSHELGHALDLPDLYDVKSDDGTDSEGIGHWGLMSSGGHNEQTSPAHLSAWSKDYLGWVSVTTLSSSQAGVSLPPIKENGQLFRVDLPSSNEHFLLSHRTASGSDIYLHGPGLLIWHIDRELAGGISEVGNGVNTNAHRKGVDLEEADGLADLDRSENRGDGGDPFPGDWNVTEFHARTDPSSSAYSGAQCGVGVRNIVMESSRVTFDLTVGERWALWGDADGNGTVATSDVTSVFWYTLGYRNPSEQRVITNGDVDGDGQVDLMDGFLLHSSLSGVAVPPIRTGQESWATCDPLSAPMAGSAARSPFTPGS